MRVRPLAAPSALLLSPQPDIPDEGVARFFQDVRECSHARELFDLAPDNVTTCADSLTRLWRSELA